MVPFRKIFQYPFAVFLSLILFFSCKGEKSSQSNKRKLDASRTVVELRIGLIPEQNVLSQIKRYRPLGDYIFDRTGIKIKFILLSRYGNIVENFNQLKLDGSFWGSFTGAMAVKKLGIEHIARPINLDGTSMYRGYIFVRKNSNIKSVKDMKQKTIAFVDKATTAGYVFPMAFFRENGVKDIKRFFKEFYFTGSHDAVIYDILNKKADVGCAKNTIYNQMKAKNPRINKELEILKTSPDVPSNGLGLRQGLDYEIKKKLKDVLLNMNKDPEGKRVLREFKVIKFIETTKKDYGPVFDMARKSGINLKDYEYRNK